MHSFIASGSELAELKVAALQLQSANASLARAKKSAEQAKETISRWLREERDCDLAVMEVGESVLINDVLLIKITPREDLDVARFKLQAPEQYARFLATKPIKHFEPL